MMNIPVGTKYVYPCRRCGAVAFYMMRDIGEEEVHFLDDIIKPDGSHPVYGEYAKCPSCHEKLLTNGHGGLSGFEVPVEEWRKR